MAFIRTMDLPTHTKLGINGADVYTEKGVGDYRVSLFTMLNRGLGGDNIFSALYEHIRYNDPLNVPLLIH